MQKRHARSWGIRRGFDKAGSVRRDWHNKPDAGETVAAMLEDAFAAQSFTPTTPNPESVVNFLMSRGVPFTTFDDWCSLDQAELADGEACARPRVKFGSKTDMLRSLGREDGRAAG